MKIRKAGEADLAAVRRLAAQHDLDYEGMGTDDFWVASEGKRIVGAIGLKKHPGCQELCSLVVARSHRKQGIGRKLISALLNDASGEVYLTTIIPGFFEKFGFEQADRVPPSMVKEAAWCAGCRPDLCRVMVKRR